MTPDQVKAARALLGWTRMQLGIRSVTSMYMVKTFENTGRVAPLYGRAEQVDSLAAIRSTFEEAGIVFIEENGGGPGVRLRELPL